MLRVLTLLRLKVQGLRLCMTLGGGGSLELKGKPQRSGTSDCSA